MRAVLIACLLLFFDLSQQPPHLSLEGTGRVCYGHLHVFADHLQWTSVYSRCRSPYTVLLKTKATWALEVQPSKACSYGVVELEPTAPGQPDRSWNISAYKDAAAYKAAPDRPLLSCNML